MSQDKVVYLCYAIKITISVDFTHTSTFSKYLANMHSSSLRTPVECIYKSFSEFRENISTQQLLAALQAFVRSFYCVNLM